MSTPTPSLPTDPSTIPSLPPETQQHILDLLFEPSPALHKLSLPLPAPPKTYSALISTIRSHLLTLLTSPSTTDAETLDAILSAHPRLGEKKVGVVGSISRAEQAGLNARDGDADGDAEEEGRRLEELNRRYEEVFPGLRYVVFVKGRGREVIMGDMEMRIHRGERQVERREAVEAMCEIALDRAEKLGGVME
ncbi:MAG: hypothetical protein M1824_001997 [Vezdaea acicularis]|nr:MAG: hypothetical protein M1824_001997 [Vezdaea acicularis]